MDAQEVLGPADSLIKGMLGQVAELDKAIKKFKQLPIHRDFYWDATAVLEDLKGIREELADGLEELQSTLEEQRLVSATSPGEPPPERMSTSRKRRLRFKRIGEKMAAEKK